MSTKLPLPPDEQPSITHKVTIGGKNVYITLVEYPNRTLSGIGSIKIGKEGGVLRVYEVVADFITALIQAVNAEVS